MGMRRPAAAADAHGPWHVGPRARMAAAVLVGAMAGALVAMAREAADRQAGMAEGGGPAAGLAQRLAESERKTHELAEELAHLAGRLAGAASDADARALARGDDLRVYLTPMPKDDALPPDLLAAVQQRANRDREVMLAFANDVMMCNNPKTCWWNGGNVLGSFLDVVHDALGMRNYLVLSLDDNTNAYLRNRGANFVPFRVEVPSAQEGSHPANQISTLKYKTVAAILAHGYSVLVSDLDLVYVKDPFEHLHRDADIEVQSDGFTQQWGFGKMNGVSDREMGWGGGGLYTEVFTLNVGCGYFRPTRATIDLLMRVYERLASEKAWDQQVFNEELSLLPLKGVTYRVMDPLVFVNSKTFWKSHRDKYLPGARAKAEDAPVMVHMNYHANKHERMLCLIDRYHHGRTDACDHLPIKS